MQVVEAVDPTDADDRDRMSFGPVVQEEVQRLRAKYRAVVALCYWQGLTQEQAAAQLACPLGTVRSRLARARNLLRRRLTRRGLASLGGVVAAGLDHAPASASSVAVRLSPVPRELVHSTIQAAVHIAAGRTTAQVISGVTASLVQRTLWSMAMIKVKIGFVGVALVALIGSTAWVAALDGPPARAQVKSVQQPASPKKNDRPVRSEQAYCLVQGQTTIISIVPEGSLVKKGDLVCELDSAALKDQLINQQITVSSARANYENARLARESAEIAVVEYQEGIFRIEIQETAGNIKIAEAELALAEAELEAAAADRGGEKLKKQRAELSVFRARFALEKAQSRKKLLVDYTKGKMVKTLRSEVEKTHSAELAKQAIWGLETAKAKKLEAMIAGTPDQKPRKPSRIQLRVWREGDVALSGKSSLKLFRNARRRYHENQVIPPRFAAVESESNFISKNPLRRFSVTPACACHGDAALHEQALVSTCEAEAVAGLRHPNIVQVYDVGDCDGRPYFTMEYVEGGSLAHKLAGAPPPARQAAQLVATLAAAVYALCARHWPFATSSSSQRAARQRRHFMVADFGLATPAGCSTCCGARPKPCWRPSRSRFGTEPDRFGRALLCARRSDDTDAVWDEASDEPSLRSSCTSRRELGGTGGFIAPRVARPRPK